MAVAAVDNRMSPGNRHRSLYVTLAMIIVMTVGFIMGVHAIFSYNATREQRVAEINEQADQTLQTISQNAADLMAAYAVNEYHKLIFNEMGLHPHLAIVVRDRNMGSITGGGEYVSGKIRDESGLIIDFDPNNADHARLFRDCAHVADRDILSDDHKRLGSVSVCTSHRALQAELDQIIERTLINAGVLSITLILALFAFIRHFVLRPLSRIVEVISDSDSDGIPLANIPLHGSKEIFALSGSMNNMINAIQRSQVALKRQKEELHYQAHHDPLTGLANRYLFNDRLQQGLKRSRRSNTRMALLFIDLDHFKEVNDSLGHKTGDEVLRITAQRLSMVLREEDTLARLGGDEFTIMIERLRLIEDASGLAEKVLGVLREPVFIEDREFYIGGSIGISIYPDNGDTAQDMLKYADAAMYDAKRDGRNGFRFYSREMTEQSFLRLSMESGLRNALKNDELVVYYQPQVDAASNRLIGVEALVRWRHPVQGMMSPAVFIPIAEASGLIVEMDRFVMRRAMQQLTDWYAQGLNPGVLALNLAMKQLKQADFSDFLSDILRDTGCRPEWLELEVTESQLMDKPEQTIKVLKRINRLGVKLALDDFGTGYSSLSYLKKLPIHKLKIDQSFVRDLPDDEDDAAITRTIIGLSQNLNRDVLAEGVETAQQARFLVNNGCARLQGYFYSRPLPAEEIEALLRTGFPGREFSIVDEVDESPVQQPNS